MTSSGAYSQIGAFVRVNLPLAQARSLNGGLEVSRYSLTGTNPIEMNQVDFYMSVPLSASGNNGGLGISALALAQWVSAIIDETRTADELRFQIGLGFSLD